LTLPDRLFFKIGEVAKLAGVEPHVIRYWEQEFRSIRPRKTRGGHRYYQRRDVELILLIKRLLHEERFTVEGARRRLQRLGREPLPEPEPPALDDREALLADLRALRSELVAMLDSIDESSPPTEADLDSDAPSD
jgi:DNA-binding transcriptional MerR regulator